MISAQKSTFCNNSKLNLRPKNCFLEIGASNSVAGKYSTKGQLRAYCPNIYTVAKGQGSKAATVVTSQDLVQPLVAVSVQSAQLRQKLQAVHDEYQKKQLHLVRQLAVSTTTVPSSVQGGYNCRVSCFELDMLDFRKLQAVRDEYQEKQLHLFSPPTGCQYHHCF